MTYTNFCEYAKDHLRPERIHQCRKHFDISLIEAKNSITREAIVNYLKQLPEDAGVHMLKDVLLYPMDRVTLQEVLYKLIEILE